MQAAPRLYARLDHETGHRHLVVCFNSYASPARGVHTALENFSWLTELGASTLWFAEDGPRGWYTGFDREINDWIVHAARRHGLTHLTLLGSSCGAYASIRHALLLAGALAPAGLALDIRAIALNPQTGFAETLLDPIRDALRHIGRSPDELGVNVVMPAAGDLCRPDDSIAISDLRELACDSLPLQLHAESHGSTLAIDILFDELNPIDRGFAEHLTGLRGVALHPHALGLDHADGARWFWKSDAFRQRVRAHVASTREAAAPVSVADVRMLLLRQFASARTA